MHGKFVSIVNENIISGSLLGNFYGTGTGSFTATYPEYELEGNALNVGNIYHIISASDGTVSPRYDSSLKFFSLNDHSDAYRGLRIAGYTFAGAVSLPDEWEISQLNTSTPGFWNPPGTGPSDPYVTAIKFTINDIHTDGLSHPYASAPYNRTGVPGLANYTISGRKLGQSLQPLKAGPGLGFQANNINVTDYSGSTDVDISLGSLYITDTATNDLLNTDVLYLVAHYAGPDLLAQLAHHDVGYTFPSLFAASYLDASSPRIDIPGNATIANVVNTIQAVNPDFSDPAPRGLILSVDNGSVFISQSAGPSAIGNNITIGADDGTGLFLYKTNIAAPTIYVNENTTITSGNTLNAVDANSRAKMTSSTGSFGQLFGRWRGAASDPNQPYDVTQTGDLIRGAIYAFTGEISGDVYNGDKISFGNGTGTSNTAADASKSGSSVPMPYAGRIVAANATYRDPANNDPIGHLIFTSNDQIMPGNVHRALTPAFANEYGDQVSHTAGNTGVFQTGAIFNAGDRLGVRVCFGLDFNDVAFLNYTYLVDQLEQWDTTTTLTDTYVQDLVCTLYVTFD